MDGPSLFLAALSCFVVGWILGATYWPGCAPSEDDAWAAVMAACTRGDASLLLI
jgi:hypothetical protein